MYEKVLVPLDGSELAECILPHLESIAKGCGVKSIVFLRAVEPVHLPVGTISDGGEVFTEQDAARVRNQADQANKESAKNYLDQVASRTKYDGVTNYTEIVIGKAADSIAEYAARNEVDLIIIATHGRSGISRWALGSVADRVLSSACVPVLMVRAPGCVPGI
ncbi:MAG TPA: universal stress protein [Dehalococcoidia bacterium]|nr:universal stress protein [Dehalococcoidia bacterium]